jgi:hypothetical protein
VIYDALEAELETLCREWEVDLKGINEAISSIGSIRLCLHCGEPFPPQTHKSRKYHIRCEQIVRNERARSKYAVDPLPVLAAVRTYRATFKRCSCCHLRPVGEGLYFLCNLCFEWDGPDWMKDQHARWEANRKPRVSA